MINGKVWGVLWGNIRVRSEELRINLCVEHGWRIREWSDGSMDNDFGNERKACSTIGFTSRYGLVFKWRFKPKFRRVWNCEPDLIKDAQKPTQNFQIPL